MPPTAATPSLPAWGRTSLTRFYGWRVVGFAAAVLAMTAPGQSVGVSVFVDPMIEGLALPRSQISGAYLVGTLAGALALPRVGRWIDRFGVRRMTAAIAAASVPFWSRWAASRAW